MKQLITIIFVVCINFSVVAQKEHGITNVGINTGVSILTASTYYKPNIHLGAYMGFATKSAKDNITANVNYSSFRFKLFNKDLYNVMDIKGGYKFFPSKQVPFYFHPGAGIGFNLAGGDPSLALSLDLGYQPKLGNNSLNIFARYSHYGIQSTLSFVNFGVGYQFNTKK